MFNWDPELSSKKLIIEDDFLTVRVKDGSGFKTSIGDQVSKVTHPLTSHRLSSKVADITSRLN